MTGGQQVPGDRPGPRLVVELDDQRGDVGVRGGTAAQHQPRPGGVEGLRVVGHARAIRLVLDDPADEDHQPGPLLPHQLHELHLPLRIPGGRPDHAQPPAVGGLGLHSLGDLGVEGAGDLPDDDGGHLAAPADQRPGMRVGDVVEIAGGTQDTGPGRGRHRMVAAERA